MTQIANISSHNTLPPGFVYLEQVEASILQEMRYAGSHNFIGRPVNGYEASKCVVSEPVAQAITKVQAEFAKQNLTLKVYDAYRPLRACEHFYKWALDQDDQVMKSEFYPDVNKADVFDLGYVALKSQHARGCAIDVTLVPLPVPAQDTFKVGDTPIDGRLPKGQRFNDNSLEMGTGFDCFDELAHTMNPNISDEAKKNRMLLKGVMENHGFENYENEWWHFSLINEPFPDTYFDFQIR